MKIRDEIVPVALIAVTAIPPTVYLRTSELMSENAFFNSVVNAIESVNKRISFLVLPSVKSTGANRFFPFITENDQNKLQNAFAADRIEDHQIFPIQREHEAVAGINLLRFVELADDILLVEIEMHVVFGTQQLAQRGLNYDLIRFQFLVPVQADIDFSGRMPTIRRCSSFFVAPMAMIIFSQIAFSSENSTFSSFLKRSLIRA